MEQAMFVEHLVRPSYSAFVIETKRGLQKLFLDGNTLVSSSALPKGVAAELVQGLQSGMRVALQAGATGAAATRASQYIKAGAYTKTMPRSIIEAIQLLPDPEAEILHDAARVAIHRPLTLGSTRQRSKYGYRSAQSHECRALFAKRGGSLVAPTPRYDECKLSAFDLLSFVDFVTQHKHRAVHQYVEDKEHGYGYPSDPYEQKREKMLTSEFEGNSMCEKILNVLPLPAELSRKIEKQHWSVVRHLGKGEYGTTFLAVNRSGKQAAVKVMVETEQEKISPKEEFHLHRLFAAMGLAPQTYYATSLRYQGTKLHIFVMERVEFTLYDLLCYQRLSPSMLESIGYSLAKFLWTMYKKGVTHGDMHSQNIMFRYNAKSKRYEPLLIDFGFATTKFNDPDIDALQLISDLNQLTRMSPNVVNYLVRVLSKVVSRIRGYEVRIGKRRSQWEEYVDDYISRRERAAAHRSMEY